PAAPAAGEQVDRGRQEGQEAGDEDELDRPAADDPRAEVDVAPPAGREGDALLERVDRVLGRPSDLAEPPGADAGGAVAEPVRRPVVRGGDRHRRDAAADEGRLGEPAVREAEVDQLAEPARA